MNIYDCCCRHSHARKDYKDTDDYEYDSDPDSIIANHIADFRLYYPSSSESDDSDSYCSDSDYLIGDYKMTERDYYSSEYEDEERETSYDELRLSLISIREIELCFNMHV